MPVIQAGFIGGDCCAGEEKIPNRGRMWKKGIVHGLRNGRKNVMTIERQKAKVVAIKLCRQSRLIEVSADGC